jgi:Ca-activated chloride channel family protein
MIDLRWPLGLVLLLTIPAAFAGYLWGTRRRRAALPFSSLALVREALPRRSRLRRHLPFGLFLVGLAALPLALARPQAVLAVPTRHTTILLAIDVSASMCSVDIPPTRLAAAKAAAEAFVLRQPPDAQVGIVAFSGTAELVHPPTTDHAALTAAIDAIAAIDPNVPPTRPMPGVGAPAPSVGPSSGRSGTLPGLAPSGAAAVVAAGTEAPEVIVLLTDGSNNSGPQPLEAAAQAAERGLRVYTIGYGTLMGGDIEDTCVNPAAASVLRGLPSTTTQPRAGAPGGPQITSDSGIDEATLRAVAQATGGAYARQRARTSSTTSCATCRR